jgi:hypothetical protein
VTGALVRFRASALGLLGFVAHDLVPGRQATIGDYCRSPVGRVFLSVASYISRLSSHTRCKLQTQRHLQVKLSSWCLHWGIGNS